MKRISTLALAAFATIALTACGGDKKDDAKKMMDEGKTVATETVTEKVEDMKTTSTAGFTKADYMKGCTAEGGLTEAQCQCTLDFYEDAGIKMADLGDQEKMTKLMTDMEPEKMMEMAKCMQ